MSDPSHWFGGHNSWLIFVGISAVMVMALITFIMFTLYRYFGVRFQFQKINSILAKLLLLNKASESIKPKMANPIDDFSTITFQMLDFKLIQIVLMIMSLTFTYYLLFRLKLWPFDYLNTKYLNINSTGLTYLKSLTLDKTNIYLQLYDFTTCESVHLYLGTILRNPEDIYCEGQFVAGRISLDQKPSYDFIDLKWDTIALSLKDLDLPMSETLQISRWQKSKVRKMFSSNNSYFRIVAHNPNTKKVRPVTDAYNLQDETLSENILNLDEEQPVAVVQAFVQPTQLEVIVTDDLCTMM